MPTVTVKLDKKRAARLAAWARRRRVTKSDIVRSLIDRASPIETVDELIEWVDASAAAGRGLGFALRKR